MKKHLFKLILVSVAALFLISGGAAALSNIYVNTSGGTLSNPLSESYAVGASGTTLLGSDDVYALSATGLKSLSSKPTPENAVGGGGLLSDSGTVQIKSDIIKVGLKYYFNTYRDSGVAEARLENAVGSGYALGYYDENRMFNELMRTDYTRLSMRITVGTGIGVYSTDTGELIYQVDNTGPSNYLGILPLSTGSDTITWFSGNKYYGGFEYAVLGAGKISVVNVVDIEKYTMGVCASEMNESWPLEALKAQAVAARTYGQKNLKSTTYFYNCGFDVTADTYCQAYSGCTTVGSNIINAVTSTANQYITYSGRLIDALYFSSDGGATEDNINVNGNSAHPYLAGIYDPYEAAADSINSFSSWTVRMTGSELAGKVGLDDIAGYEISTSETGNVISIRFISSSGKSVTFQRSYCRTALGLYSIRYELEQQSNGDFVFSGSGWGHNLGMSQYGAYAMAKHYYKTYKDILGFYYTQVSLSYGII